MIRYQYNQHRKSGFTLLELVIVIAVVLILASVAVSQSSSTLDFLRFNKTFNKIIFMVQKTRDLAITAGKSDEDVSAVFAYYTKFSVVSGVLGVPDAYHVEIFAKKTARDERIEDFSVPANISLRIESGVSSCTLSPDPPQLSFSNRTADLSFTCSGVSDPASIKVKLSDSSRQKSFVIHKASGVPRVE